MSWEGLGGFDNFGRVYKNWLVGLFVPKILFLKAFNNL